MMLTPTTQKSSTAIFQASEEGGDQPANFHGWWITKLPDYTLATITQYLSMQDVDNLGRVCRKLQSSLMTCGLPIIRHYLSMTKNQQRFYQQMATGNRQLIDQIRKKKIIPGEGFPVQFSPAMCVPFTRSLRQRLVSSTAISLEPRGCIEATPCNIHGCYFKHQVVNKNLNLLTQENPELSEITYWKADINGFWSSDHRFRYSREVVRYLQFEPDLQFTRCSDSNVFIWDEGEFELLAQQVKLSVADSPDRLSLSLSGHNTFKLSDDKKTLVHLKSQNAIIYSLENNNHWHCKGRFATVDDALFSPDGLYIALRRVDEVCFLKRTRSGSWISSGNINYVKRASDLDVWTDKTVLFSPDGCHVMAKSMHAQFEHGLKSKLVVDATIGSIDSDGQWFTQNVISKPLPDTVFYRQSGTRFTLDGKHIIVAGKTDFDAWRLSEDGQWIETVKNRCYADNLDLFLYFEVNMQLSREGALMMIDLSNHIVIWAVDSDGLWYRQMQEPSAHTFLAQFSPDGKSLVCHDVSGQTAIWLRDPFNHWHRQTAEIPHLSMARFNDQSCLLAGELYYPSRGIVLLLGLTPQQIWQEKGRLIVDGHILELSFSPCSRSMQVSYCKENKWMTTFWQIEPHGSGDNSPT